MARTDPISLVEDELWTRLEARATISAISTRCRVKYTGSNRDPDRWDRGGTDADYPKIRVRPQAIKAWSYRTSNQSNLLVRYYIEFKIGEQTTEDINNLTFEVFRAVTNWITGMEALQWKSKSFVEDCRLYNAEEELDDSKRHKGWLVAWQCDVDMFFTTSDLTAAT